MPPLLVLGQLAIAYTAYVFVIIYLHIVYTMANNAVLCTLLENNYIIFYGDVKIITLFDA